MSKQEQTHIEQPPVEELMVEPVAIDDCDLDTVVGGRPPASGPNCP